MISLQHDVGKWCTEYSWSADDGMWGVRLLHNFGRLGIPPDTSSTDGSQRETRPKRVDEEEATGGGLKGRVSAGAEFYFSAKEKSAGGEHPYLLYKRRADHIFSIHWYPFHYTSRRDTAIFSTAGEFIISFVYGITARSTFTTHNYHCLI